MARPKKEENKSVEEKEAEAARMNQQEEVFQNVSTVDDPENVPEVFPYECFEENFKPFKHQSQTVYLCLETEKKGTYETEVRNPNTGELEGHATYTSRVGCIANGTGSGKTICAAALACYDIEETREEHDFGTELTTMRVVPLVDRPLIKVTFLLGKVTNCEKMFSETSNYMKNGLVSALLYKAKFNELERQTYVEEIEADYDEKMREYTKLDRRLEKFEEEYSELINDTMEKSQQKGKTLYDYAVKKNIRKIIEFCERAAEVKRMKEELEESKVFRDMWESPEMQYGILYQENNTKYNNLINSSDERKRRYKEKILELSQFLSDKENIGKYKLAQKYMMYYNLLKGKKLFICSEQVFQHFFPLFKTHRIQRLIIDEPQEISTENGDGFKRGSNNNAIDFLWNPKNPSTNIAKEKSPALMVWFMSATIHNMFDREDLKGRYIITWASRNAPFLRDFFNSSNVSYMFPQMVKRQIIKFSKEYSMHKIVGDVEMHEKKFYRVKRPTNLQMVEGIFEGSEMANIQQMIHNDNTEDLYRFFGIDNDQQISNGIIGKLRDKIADLRKKIEGYETKTGYHAREAEQKIKDLQDKIALVERRNRAINEHTCCSICFQEVEIPENPKKEPTEEWLNTHAIISCSSCFVRTHLSCYKQLIDKSHCICCRVSTVQAKPQFLYSSRQKIREIDDENNEIIPENEQEENLRTYEEITETKIEAFDKILEDAETRDIYTLKGKRPKTRPYTKLLIFLNVTDKDSQSKKDVMQKLVNEGYTIFMQKSGQETQQKLAEEYNAPQKKIFKLSTKTEFTKRLEEFREFNGKSAWIMKNLKDASGMDFEFVTDIICYTSFGNMVQIAGRGERPNRKIKFNLYIMTYETKQEEEQRQSRAMETELENSVNNTIKGIIGDL